MITIPLTIFFTLFARDSIVFISGEAFADATLSMQLLMPTVFFNALNGMTGNQMLVPLGREKAVMLSVIIGAVLDFVLNFFVIPKMGAAGAALSTLLAEFIVLVVQIFFLKDHLGKVIRGVKTLPIFISAAVSTGAEIAILHYMSVSNVFLRLVIGAVSFFGIYFVLLLIQREKFLMENIALVFNKIKAFLSPRKQQTKGE